MSKKVFNLRYHAACDVPWEDVSLAFEKAVAITTQSGRHRSTDGEGASSGSQAATTHIEMGLDFVRANLMPQAVYNFQEAVRRPVVCRCVFCQRRGIGAGGAARNAAARYLTSTSLPPAALDQAGSRHSGRVPAPRRRAVLPG